VNRPGAYKVEEGTTIRKAIALAGGLTDISAPGRTKLIRKVNGVEKEFSVDMSFPVLPDDVVSIPESFF
jgi:polysaccharide export outer membrane protein